MTDGYLKIAAGTPLTTPAGIVKNIDEMAKMIRQAVGDGCAAIAFPELAVTGYTCGDLFKDVLLIKKAERELEHLIQKTADLEILCAVGVPVRYLSGLYNCAAVFFAGKLLAVVPKLNLPDYAELCESRFFTKGDVCCKIRLCNQETILCPRVIFCCENEQLPYFSVGVEIGADLYACVPPSVELAENGATLLMNLSAEGEVVGGLEYRKSIVSAHSARTLSAYCYAGSGAGESTTDLVFSGHRIIAANGKISADSGLFTDGFTAAEIDFQRLWQERVRINTWGGVRGGNIQQIGFRYSEKTLQGFVTSTVEPRFPFVPSDPIRLDSHCETILTMQAVALSKRLSHIGCDNVVLAVSGGLDSTLAAIATARAFDRLELNRKGILAVSMPCFGTTDRTKNNALKMARELGFTYREISIKKAVLQHFEDIGHNRDCYDVVFENAQARERTQVIMDLANMTGAIVVGTGDLSELALGFATYNGDHMSMYAVNADIPKTLIRHIVGYAARKSHAELREVLLDVLNTPVSPELLPPKEGEIAQKTEDIVGPYELHDYFLYYLLRFGFEPKKIYAMARASFDGAYSGGEIKKWITLFYKRFFSQQFKRSCMPDGPKVGTVSLSPRGDFRMPSDAVARIWLDDIEKLK